MSPPFFSSRGSCRNASRVSREWCSTPIEKMASKVAVAERQPEDVGLNDGHVGAIAEVLLRGFHRKREVDADDVGAPARRDVKEAARAAADVEHQLAAQLRRR